VLIGIFTYEFLFESVQFMMQVGYFNVYSDDRFRPKSDIETRFTSGKFPT